MADPAFTNLLAQLRMLHTEVAAIARFCPFPDDLVATPMDVHRIEAASLLQTYSGSFESRSELLDAFLLAAPAAHWRETYKGRGGDAQFLGRFGCYGVISNNAPWSSEKMRGFMVCMPPMMNYPAHQHPAEELYFVVAGEAEFRRKGHAPEWLGQGKTMVHSSNQPHAMRTGAAPVLAYVIWRNNLTTLPVWSDPEQSV